MLGPHGWLAGAPKSKSTTCAMLSQLPPYGIACKEPQNDPAKPSKRAYKPRRAIGQAYPQPKQDTPTAGPYGAD